MPWARASAIHRHLECAEASWLPRADRGKWSLGFLAGDEQLQQLVQLSPPEDDSVMAQWGTEMHLAKEGSPNASDPWESWVAPERERLWPSGLGVHELTWAYDCRTQLVTVYAGPREQADEWKSGRGPDEVTGTTDWHATLPGGEPWVDDLKTGWMKPAVTAPQMMMYALVAWILQGRRGTVRLSITHWRRGWEYPDRAWQQVGPVTLESFEDEVRAAWRRALRHDGPVQGPWCKYCPSAPVCPAVIGDALQER